MGRRMKIHYQVMLQVESRGMSTDPHRMDVLRHAWIRAGAGLFDIVEESEKSVWRTSVFLPHRAAAAKMARALRELNLKGVKVAMRVHQRTDWESRWKQGWKPFSLTRKIHVIPLFLKKATCPRGKIPFYLDTTAAFGTGLHETTRFSARLIEGVKGRFNSVLDVGTGTGILAAVARMSGATYVEAFDIDADAVSVAGRNLKVNGLKCDALRACGVQDYQVRRQFDLVAANLITHDLLAFRPKIMACVRPGGYLVVSGISIPHMRLIRRAYGDSAGMKCLKVLQGKEWSAFLFQRSLDDQ